jgi:hypothetical protein
VGGDQAVRCTYVPGRGTDTREVRIGGPAMFASVRAHGARSKHSLDTVFVGDDSPSRTPASTAPIDSNGPPRQRETHAHSDENCSSAPAL